MSNSTLTVYIEQTGAGSYSGYIKEMLYLMRVSGNHLLEVYCELFYQVVYMIHEREDIKQIRIHTQLVATRTGRNKLN